MEQLPLTLSGASSKPKTVYTARDRLLLLITLVLCVTADRLLFALFEYKKRGISVNSQTQQHICGCVFFDRACLSV